ncbi:hypothetical protein [Candidatus Ichthyocystis sparus]|uniref:hypothetical protein n=1 Tax=Candidatus Ichthyocystis sparus TaxID=1561004 RepID=UPI000B85C703|nr:hypothetical protein [Candidatus Ichthyocystis sparus]
MDHYEGHFNCPESINSKYQSNSEDVEKFIYADSIIVGDEIKKNCKSKNCSLTRYRFGETATTALVTLSMLGNVSGSQLLSSYHCKLKSSICRLIFANLSKNVIEDEIEVAIIHSELEIGTHFINHTIPLAIVDEFDVKKQLISLTKYLDNAASTVDEFKNYLSLKVDSKGYNFCSKRLYEQCINKIYNQTKDIYGDCCRGLGSYVLENLVASRRRTVIDSSSCVFIALMVILLSFVVFMVFFVVYRRHRPEVRDNQTSSQSDIINEERLL